MHGAFGPQGYKDVILFLATASIVAPLFQRLRLSPILGLLLAGVALGPHGLGRLKSAFPWTRYLSVERPADISELAQLGVVFLLFMVGLELSWERLRLLRDRIFGLGAAQILGAGFAIGLVAAALGVATPTAAVIGVGLALSSTALTLPALSEQRRLASEAGRAAFAVLLAQDLAVAPILVALSVIAGGGARDFAHLVLAFAPAAGGLALLVVVGRLGLRPLMRAVARAKSPEAFTAACLLVIIGAGLAIGLIGLKGVVAFALARLSGLRVRPALEAGLALSAAGEFAFVILAQASETRLATPELTDDVGLIAGLTMFATPFLTQLGARLARHEAPGAATA